MKFGNFLFPDCRDPERDGIVIDETIREAWLSDALGVDVIWLAEHQRRDYCLCRPDQLCRALAPRARSRQLRSPSDRTIIPSALLNNWRSSTILRRHRLARREVLLNLRVSRLRDHHGAQARLEAQVITKALDEAEQGRCAACRWCGHGLQAHPRLSAPLGRGVTARLARHAVRIDERASDEAVVISCPRNDARPGDEAIAAPVLGLAYYLCQPSDCSREET
jgi:hypothetical protein